jgi:hypothetical protein
VVWLAIGPSDQIFLAIAVNILGFFLLAIVCHGELARRRPPARYLTAFYLWLSAGGVIGGIFAGLIAMHLFSWVAEYPLLIVLAALCRPGLSLWRGRLDALFWGAAAVAIATMLIGGLVWHYEFYEKAFNYWVAAFLALSLAFYRDVLKFSTVIAGAFLFVALFGADSGNRDFVRSFFGVHKVLETDSGQFRILKHGTIEHGAQRIRDDEGNAVTGRPEVLTYYHDKSPLAQGIAAMRERRGGLVKLAVVGLGTGSLACQTAPGDLLHYYEIDRAVVRIALDPNRFTYLASCAPNPTIIVGDARLTLVDAKDGQYDVLIIDAFSSDAIPTHLLTQEAMAMYVKKIAPDGIILMHVSNKHMKLVPVVAGITDANDLVARVNESEEGTDDDNHKFGSTVVAVARKDEHFGALAKSEDWKEEEADPDEWVWTDDYSNVLGAMIKQMQEEE